MSNEYDEDTLQKLEVMMRFSSYPIKKLISLKYNDISISDFDDKYDDFIASITIKHKNTSYKVYTDVVKSDYKLNFEEYDLELINMIKKQLGMLFMYNYLIYNFLSSKFIDNFNIKRELDVERENTTMFINKDDEYRLGFIIEEL